MAWRHFATAAMLAALVGAGAALAHSGATGIVKQRMDAMSAIGDDMKKIGLKLRGSAPFDAGQAQAAARAIAHHASHMDTLFPPGSLSPPTEALPAIWDNWDEFAGLTEALNRRADGLAQLAGSGASEAEIAAQFQALGKTCSACHEKFRIKK